MDQAYKVKVQLAYRICQHYVKLIEKKLEHENKQMPLC